MTDRIVGVADMALSADPAVRLITYALGSCLGVTVHDPVAGIGALLHVMLPSSEIDPEKAIVNPFVFINTGVPELFRACFRAGAVRERLVVTVAGGSYAGDSEEVDHFQIGRRNVVALTALLAHNGIPVDAWHVGEQRTSRTMSLRVATGDVRIRAYAARPTPEGIR